MAELENQIAKFPECAGCKLVAKARSEMKDEHPGHTVFLNHCRWSPWSLPTAEAELSGALIENRRVPFIRQGSRLFQASLIVIPVSGACDHVVTEAATRIMKFLRLA